MNKMKFFTVFAFLLFLLIGYRTYVQFNDLKNTEKLILLHESQSLSEFVSAFRQTYQDTFITHQIPVDDKTINLLPVKTITEISKKFSQNVNGEVLIRTVSDRPRNSLNMANNFELNEITYFKNNTGEADHITQKKGVFNYTKPIYVQESCLKCHGKREDAIPSIREKYTTAYDYKIGDIRGLLNIEIKKRNIFNKLYKAFFENLLWTVFLYFVFLFLIYLLIQKMRKRDEEYTYKLKEDIHKKTEELESQKDTFETLFEKSSYGITIVIDGEFTQCNEKVVEILGYKNKDELLNVHPSVLSPEFQDDGRSSFEKAEEMIALAIKNGHNEFQWTHRRANGEDFLAEITLTPITLNNKLAIYGVWRDISDSKKAELIQKEQKNLLDYQAHHDALTGLPNRTLFHDRIVHGIDQAKRYDKILALFFIDLDHFKEVNDSLGHHIGDKLLIEVSKRFKKELRAEDTLSRFGGDEFTILANNLDNVQYTSLLAEKLQQVLSIPINIDGHSLYISCSIGISIYPHDSADIDNLLKYADMAMYKAKDMGRNNTQFYSKEMTDFAQKRFQMQTDLRQALSNNEFFISYQPQIDSKLEKLVGLEALVRWNHPVKGVLQPLEFIGLAEETGMIVELDSWVMLTAMKQMSTWYNEGFIPGTLSLNLSMRQLREDNFVRDMERKMKDSKFNPEWLELEITESQMMKKPEESIMKLAEISNMGISISIDDFGTGYSSLAYLKRLPVNKVKIDKSFIIGMLDNQEDFEILKAIIALSKSLGLGIIAEGVETEKQKDILIEHGCECIQGYYYSKPILAEEVENKYFK